MIIMKNIAEESAREYADMNYWHTSPVHKKITEGFIAGASHKSESMRITIEGKIKELEKIKYQGPTRKAIARLAKISVLEELLKELT